MIRLAGTSRSQAHRPPSRGAAPKPFQRPGRHPGRLKCSAAVHSYTEQTAEPGLGTAARATIAVPPPPAGRGQVRLRPEPYGAAPLRQCTNPV
jgi:hypothetical protein